MDKIEVLIIDDEAGFREASASALERRGLVVTQADSGRAGLEAIRRRRPDVVVLDLKMAGMDGIATLTEIRRVDEELPVLILTGHGELNAAMTGIRLGIVDFLQKPIDMDQLAERIRHLGRKRQSGVLRERTVRELMVPPTSYLRVASDQPLREVVRSLRDSFEREVSGRPAEHGHRCVLIFHADRKFAGVVRIGDIVDRLVPEFLRSPYSSYFTGMFLAQCKLFGNQPIGEFLELQVAIDLDTPLMEAAYLLAHHKLINLPVIAEGELVGILRDKDLLLEVAASIL